MKRSELKKQIEAAKAGYAVSFWRDHWLEIILDEVMREGGFESEKPMNDMSREAVTERLFEVLNKMGYQTMIDGEARTFGHKDPRTEIDIKCNTKELLTKLVDALGYPPDVDEVETAVKAWSNMDVVDMTRDNLVAKGDRMRDTLMKRIEEQAETIESNKGAIEEYKKLIETQRAAFLEQAAKIRELEARLNAPEPEELVRAREEYKRINYSDDENDTEEIFCDALIKYKDELIAYIELLKGRK